MTNLIKFIKNFLSFNKSDLSAKRVVTNFDNMTEILNVTFMHPDLFNNIKKDLIILIISNNFVVKPVVILSFFKNYYNFTINEFIILSFRVGMLSKVYIDNLVYLLEDAIKLEGSFSKENIEYFKKMLEYQLADKQRAFEQEVAMFQEKLERESKQRKLKSKDEEANEQIDAWLRKQKNK